MDENKNKVTKELIEKICRSAVQDLWHLMSVDGSVSETAIKLYLEHNPDYSRLKIILDIDD